MHQHIWRLKELSKLTKLVLEIRLAELRTASLARDSSRAALIAISVERRDIDLEIQMPALARADLLYERWVERQKDQINLKLASETAVWICKSTLAAHALGRDTVLGNLTNHATALLRKKQGQL